MRQLSGIDAAFLYMETPETPMHVAGLTLFEPPADFSGSFFEHFREFFLSRMHLAPIFAKKLARTVFELDHPLWVDEDDIDFDYHLRHVTAMSRSTPRCTPPPSMAAPAWRLPPRSTTCRQSRAR